MTKDQTIAMARKAGAWPELSMTPEKDLAFLQRFAQLVAAQAAAEEREECAKVCDVLYAPASCNAIERALWSVAMQECAAAIRERKSP